MGVNVDFAGVVVGVVVGEDAAVVAAVDTVVVASVVVRIEDVGLSVVVVESGNAGTPVASGEGWVSVGASGDVVAVDGSGVLVFDISVTG